MSESEKQEKNYKLAAAMTVAVFCMGQIPGSIDAAISKISEYFQLSQTSGLYVTTVASLVSVAFGILLGFIAGKKIGFRPLIFFCATVELISAIAPFFTDSFAVILVLRGFFGIGFGGMQSLENTVAVRLIPLEKRAGILGMGTFFGFGMNCLLQFIGGYLADMGWNYVFLNHLLLIFPYAIVVIGCLRLDFGGEGIRLSDQGTEGSKAEKQKLSGHVYQLWLLLFFVGVMIAPLLIGCSFLSEPINDSATIAGIVAVFFSVGCMVGGILYSKVFVWIKEKALPLFLLLMAIGICGCGITRTIPGLCILIFLAGIGFSASQATSMLMLGMITQLTQIALASSVMMALFNLGMFLSSPYEAAVGKLTGDALYLPLYIGAAVILIFAVVYTIIPPYRHKNKA